jgi:hypothetical protein
LTRDSLFLEAELLHDRAVAALVVLFKVTKMGAAISNHLEKTATGMKILLVLLKMSRKLVYLAAKDSYLNIGRASVGVMASHVFYSGGLYSFRKH